MMINVVSDQPSELVVERKKGGERIIYLIL